MQVDTTVVGAVGQAVGGLGTLVIGTLSAAATQAVKVGARWVESQAGIADRKVTGAFGPLWPVVAGALAIGLPLAGNALHITDLPSAAVVASAPLSAVVAVVLREVGKRIF